MTYKDFFELATWANESWRGSFTAAEIAENAHTYTIEYNALGCSSEIIKSLLEQLLQDGSDEADGLIKMMIEDDKNGKEYTMGELLDSVATDDNIEHLGYYITRGDNLGLYGVGDYALERINEIRGYKED